MIAVAGQNVCRSGQNVCRDGRIDCRRLRTDCRFGQFPIAPLWITFALDLSKCRGLIAVFLSHEGVFLSTRDGMFAVELSRWTLRSGLPSHAPFSAFLSKEDGLIAGLLSLTNTLA